MSTLQVSLIGSGNVAWHLAPELDNIGYFVREVYSRNTKNARKLIGRLYQAELKKDLDFSESTSQIFIVAVSDDAIDEIAREIVVPEASVLVHTSGSKSMEVLGYASTPNIGVFYPLQTFSKDKKVHFQDVPICIEAENRHTRKTLKKMADRISESVYQINSDSRQALHIAAVFACNFTNHLFTIAKDMLDNNHLDFEMLKPLIVETINKSLALGPQQAQTGPARRCDLEVLDKHLKALESHKSYADIYKLITQSILDTYPSE